MYENNLTTHISIPPKPWKEWELILFRVIFVFSLILVVPMNTAWYAKVFSSPSLLEFIRALCNSFAGSAHTLINLFPENQRWDLASYTPWLNAFLVSLVIGFAWTVAVRKKEVNEYNNLLYWMNVGIRYKIAFGIVSFALGKVFPTQMPEPTISNLTTNFGDYAAFKLYWQHVGVVTWYQVILGLIEYTGMTLLFFQRTVWLGAIINFAVLFNVAHANHAYDGGVHLNSATITLLSLILFAPSLPALYRVFIKKQDVDVPELYRPAFRRKSSYYFRITLKYGSIFVCIVLFTALRAQSYLHGRWRIPSSPGLRDAAGVYDVKEFRRNGRIIPPSPTDTIRWQSVVFEKFATMVIQKHQPVSIGLTTGPYADADVDRSYELSGIAGGHLFYDYSIDTNDNILYLRNKTLSYKKNRDDSFKESRQDTIPLLFHYKRPDAATIIVTGIDHQDTLSAVLKRIDRFFPLTKQHYASGL